MMLARSAARVVRPVLHAASRTSCLGRSAHTLPALPYGYKDLEPTISEKIMTIHHTKHHQAYINGLNAAEAALSKAITEGNVGEMVKQEAAIKFNGGGHMNHDLFWKNLKPTKNGGGGAPSGDLAKAITSSFGSFDDFKAKFNAAAVGVKGSGWAWLGYDTASKSLTIATTANQDPLGPTTGLVPLLGVDVWEHAYYIDYENRRPDYMTAIWNVINWGEVQSRFDAAKK